MIFYTDMLRGFWLRISDSRGIYDSNPILKIHQGGTLTTNRTIEVVLDLPFDGRFIEILLPAKGRQLSLCEVEVFGGMVYVSAPSPHPQPPRP